MLSHRLSHVTRRQVQHVVAVASRPSPSPCPEVMRRRMLQGASCSSVLQSSSHHDSASHSYSSTASSSLTTSSTQTQTVLITAVGLDRVGIVHDLTKAVIEVGGNVGSSQAATLGNYFSFLMLVHVPPTTTTTTATDGTTAAGSAVETLTKKLQQIQDLSVIVANATATITNTTPTTIGYKGRLTLEGADNPGIMNKVR